jgi:hypothetical protein
MKRNSIVFCSLAALTWVLTGCGGGGETKPAEKQAASAEGAVYQPTGDEGTVTGKVAFTGQAPKAKAILMDADAVCASKHKDPVYPETVVANKNATLRNVFVYVKTGLEGKSFAVPTEPATIDQDGCQYKPHVLGMRARQTLKVMTSDDTTHNIHPMPKVNREWNVSQPPKADPIMQTFSRAEVSVPVKCNQHPWMKAFIHVVDNPFFAVTGDDGSFELKGLPPGTYEIESVHEQYGAQVQKVTVAAKGTATAEFTYKPDQAYRPSSLQLLPALVVDCCGGK